VAWGDGWMPTRATPEDIKMGRATLDALADAAGRAASSLEITVYSQDGDPDTLKRFEDAGASRVTMRLPTTVGEAALTELERMAERLFA
jgi:alkanesulfonate monooxygenase SsuD/methylene tetrahydromethanopterin reductase-like flavin-dependent oxidoreductase (luciferase family)